MRALDDFSSRDQFRVAVEAAASLGSTPIAAAVLAHRCVTFSRLRSNLRALLLLAFTEKLNSNQQSVVEASAVAFFGISIDAF